MIFYCCYASFWNNKEEGWHWYKEEPIKKETPSKYIEDVKKQMHAKLSKALLAPLWKI